MRSCSAAKPQMPNATRATPNLLFIGKDPGRHKQAGQVMRLTGHFVGFRFQTVLLLSRGLCLFLGRWPGFFSGSFLLEQSQGIRGVERIFADGFLTGGAQGNVYATIARQEDRLHVVEHSLALFWSELRVPLNRIFYLRFVQILFLAKRLGFELCGGNAVFDQEAFGALDAPFGERLVVFRGAAWVGMAFKR